MTDDPARTYELLRAETAQMLNLKLDSLSPTDGLRLDLTALLRLQLDSLQGLALAGRDVDMSRLGACVAMLQRMMPPASLSPESPEPDFSDAAAEFAKLIEQRAGALKARVDHVLAQEVARLNALIAQKDATIERLNAATPKRAVDTPPAAPAPAQTSNQPPLHSSSAPYVRRGDNVVEGGGRKWWGPVGDHR